MQGLHCVLLESLEVLLVVHLILVVECEEGLGARVGRLVWGSSSAYTSANLA
jgi:hypothetical protein